MESPQEPGLRIRIKHVVVTTVESVRQMPDGLYVHFEGSRESIRFVSENAFKAGDQVKITFEKVQP